MLLQHSYNDITEIYIFLAAMCTKHDQKEATLIVQVHKNEEFMNILLHFLYILWHLRVLCVEKEKKNQQMCPKA